MFFRTATAALVLATASFVKGQQTLNVKQTFYGYPDNGGNSGTAFSCDGRGYTAGGSGSEGNPQTFASPDGAYNQCEVFYYPYLGKYLVNQDICAGCSGNQIDVWIGNGNGGSGETQCEDDLTPGSNHNLIRYPGSSESVNTAPLYTVSGGCMPQNVPGNS